MGKTNVTDGVISKFVKTLETCFLTGDVELGIKLNSQFVGNVLYVTDERTGRKFSLTIKKEN